MTIILDLMKKGSHTSAAEFGADPILLWGSSVLRWFHARSGKKGNGCIGAQFCPVLY